MPKKSNSKINHPARMPNIRVGKLSEFKTATNNANKHTQVGIRELDRAMSEDGFVSPITVSADGESLDGSARLERSYERFGDDAIVIEHDGTRPIVAVRKDIPNAKTKIAKRIGVRANRVAQLDLDWDAEALAALAKDERELLEGMWNDSEINEILGAEAGTPNFQPVGIDEQPRLDQKKPVTCPKCGNIFSPE